MGLRPVRAALRTVILLAVVTVVIAAAPAAPAVGPPPSPPRRAAATVTRRRAGRRHAPAPPRPRRAPPPAARSPPRSVAPSPHLRATAHAAAWPPATLAGRASPPPPLLEGGGPPLEVEAPVDEPRYAWPLRRRPPYSRRSERRRTHSGRVTGVSTSPGPLVNRCWRRAGARWSSRASSRGRCRVGPARRRPAHDLRAARARRSRGCGGGDRRCARRPGCGPSRLRVGLPALGCAARSTGVPRSARPAPSAVGSSAARAGPLARPVSQVRASSSSLPRSRPTRRACSWHTRDSVTPSIRPISASVRFSR